MYSTMDKNNHEVKIKHVLGHNMLVVRKINPNKTALTMLNVFCLCKQNDIKKVFV
jgi:hypothetical protein